MGSFRVTSELRTAPEKVWRHAVSAEGVNREFWPLLRMTFPSGTVALTEGWEPGRRLFRSWLLLGGIIPVDYDDAAFVEVEPGERFLERSRLASQRLWEHERVVEAVPGGCRLTDRVRFEPRIRALEGLYARIFEIVFRHRHRNLRRLFGSPSGG